MKFALLGYGTEGDTRPLAFLARALIDAGHEAIQLADASTLGTAKALGVPAVPLAGDIRGTLDPQQAISGVLKEGAGVTRTTRALANIANANATSWLRTTVGAARGCDALIVSGLAAFVGFSAAEFLRIPAIGAGMIPITPTREFPSPFLPTQRLPSFLNRASQSLVNQLLWRAFRAETNRARAAVCDLPPRRRLWQGHPMLYGISPSLCPTPADWPDNALMCGQWTRPVEHWTAPAALQAFLDAGEAPLYIGFGSMLGFDNAALRRTIVDAVGDRRTVFQPGWSGIDTSALPANIHVIGDTPHDWLFPRVGVVVHHGGSGTSHSATRAGVPSVVVPFAGDQFFWADRLRRAGVSPTRLDGRSLDAASLAEAIDAAAQPEIRGRAETLGRRMRAEDGLATAVTRIEALMR